MNRKQRRNRIKAIHAQMVERRDHLCSMREAVMGIDWDAVLNSPEVKKSIAFVKSLSKEEREQRIRALDGNC